MSVNIELSQGAIQEDNARIARAAKVFVFLKKASHEEPKNDRRSELAAIAWWDLVRAVEGGTP